MQSRRQDNGKQVIQLTNEITEKLHKITTKSEENV